MEETSKPVNGKEVMDETIALARQIADICISSGLKSVHSVNSALNIAREILEANASENALR